MTLHQRHTMYAAAGWALLVPIAGSIAGLTPFTSAIAVALFPAGVAAVLWNHQAQSMAQSIQQAIR